MLIRGVIKCTGFNLFMIGDQRHAVKRESGGRGASALWPACSRLLHARSVSVYARQDDDRGLRASNGLSPEIPG